MYWSDVHMGTISRAYFNGSEPEILFTSPTDPAICEISDFLVILYSGGGGGWLWVLSILSFILSYIVCYKHGF